MLPSLRDTNQIPFKECNAGGSNTDADVVPEIAERSNALVRQDSAEDTGGKVPEDTHTISVNQQDTTAKESKERRKKAQKPPPTNDECHTDLGSNDGASKQSWITGRMLVPGHYMPVYVESSLDPLYRRVLNQAHKARNAFKADGTSEEKELLAKCAVCGVKGSESKMKTAHMHDHHQVSFWSWCARQRANNDAEKTTEKEPEITTFKRKYSNLVHTVREWAKAEDEESAQVLKKIKRFVQRRKCAEENEPAETMVEHQ
jgi:hypothetical protein